MPGWIDGYRMLEVLPFLYPLAKREAIIAACKNAESEARWDLILRRQRRND